MLPLLAFIRDYIIGIYIYIVFASVVMSWLVAFGIINNGNNFVYSLQKSLHALTEPVYAPIRRMLPDLGGIDVSPIIVLLGCLFLQNVVISGWLMPMFL